MAKGRSIFYKERDWDDFHFYNGSVLQDVRVIQPSVYHEYRGSISTTYHSDYYDRLLPAGERNEGLQFKHDRYSKSKIGVILSPETTTQVLVPPNFANGHFIMEDESIFFYKMAYQGEYNDVQDQKTIMWNDKRFSIDWPVPNPILSKRDGK